jgi:preprotein translocase subunit YajC
MMMNEWIALIAQTTPPATQPAQRPGGGEFFLGQLLPLILMIGVFYWIMMRGNRRERQKHEDMLKNVKRNDRVQTIGGILGTVVDVRDNEVVLKVDEASNTKMRFVRGAIKEVIRDAPVAETK